MEFSIFLSGFDHIYVLAVVIAVFDQIFSIRILFSNFSE